MKTIEQSRIDQKQQILNNLRVNFSRTETQSSSLSDALVKNSKIYASVRMWLGLQSETGLPTKNLSEVVFNDSDSELKDTQDAVKQLGTHRGVRGWSIFSGTDFGNTLTNHMQMMLKEFLTYEEFFKLYDECKILNSPNTNQKSFMRFVNAIKSELVASPEYKAEDIKKELLLHFKNTEIKDKNSEEYEYNQKKLVEYRNSLNNFSLGLLSKTEEEKLREGIVKKAQQNTPKDQSVRQSVIDRLIELNQLSQKMKLVKVSPSITLLQRQQEETKIIKNLQDNLILLDANEFQKSHIDDKEIIYLNKRITQIINEFDYLNYSKTFKKLNREAQEELQSTAVRISDLKLTINKILLEKEQIDKDKDIFPKNKILFFEWIAILEQHIACIEDKNAFKEKVKSIKQLNLSVCESLTQVKQCLSDKLEIAYKHVDVESKLRVAIKNQIDSINASKIPELPTVTNDDIKLYLQNVNNQLKQVHMYESELLRAGNKETVTQFLNKNSHEILRKLNTNIQRGIIEDPQRVKLNSIKTYAERTSIRHKQMVRDVILQSISHSVEGVRLVKVLKLASYDKSVLDKPLISNERIQDSANRAITRMVEDNFANLQHTVYSTNEFITHIKSGSTPDKVLSEIDYEELYKKLDLSAINEWHRELQQIWIDTLSYDVEQDILGIADKTAQEQKMVEHFSVWMLEKTGFPFKEKLSFMQTKVKDREKMLTPTQKANIVRAVTNRFGKSSIISLYKLEEYNHRETNKTDNNVFYDEEKNEYYCYIESKNNGCVKLEFNKSVTFAQRKDLLEKVKNQKEIQNYTLKSLFKNYQSGAKSQVAQGTRHGFDNSLLRSAVVSPESENLKETHNDSRSEESEIPEIKPRASKLDEKFIEIENSRYSIASASLDNEILIGDLDLPDFLSLDNAPSEASVDGNMQLLKAKFNGTAFTNLDTKINLVLEMVKSLEEPISRNISLYLYSQFLDVVTNLDINKQNHKDLFKMFIDFSLDNKYGINVFAKDNSWRKVFLKSYLNIFEKQLQNVVGSENNRKYLRQFYILAEMDLPLIEVGSKANDVFQIDKIGKLLQASPVSFEGLEESEIQHIFHGSADIEKTPKTRAIIDYLRARACTNKDFIISSNLLPHFFSESMFEKEQKYSDEDWAEASRSLMFILGKFSSDEVEDIFKGEFYLNLENFNSDKSINVNSSTLAPPLNILKADIMLQLFSRDCHNYEKIAAEFNQQLIASKVTSQMLMGYAREIIRLTQLFKSTKNINNFAVLLKIKMAYQSLKKEYFKDEAKIGGFLKMYVDNAECQIASSGKYIEEFIEKNSTHDKLDEIVKSYKIVDHSENESNNLSVKYAENIAFKVFKAQQEDGIALIVNPPVFLSFGKTDVNYLSGAVYYDGHEYEGISPYLYNHPHVRSLEMQDLQYLNLGGEYCYYSDAVMGKKPSIQARIVSSDNTVVIQKRLVCDFKITTQTALLQFLPLENHGSIPAAVSQHFGIEEIWFDNKSMYGFNHQGKLIAKFKHDKKSKLWNIETTTQKFSATSDKNFLSPVSSVNKILRQLLKSVSVDEILIGEDNKSFFIPAMKLTIKLKSGNWECNGTDIANMIIDVENASASLVLKPKERQKLPAKHTSRLKKLQDELKQKQDIRGASLIVKNRIKQIEDEIALLKSTLAKYEGKLYLVTQPNMAEVKIVRKNMNDAISLIKDSYTTLKSSNKYSEEKKKLEKVYLNQAVGYAENLAKYQTLTNSLPTFRFKSAGGDRVTPNDLQSSLYITQQQIEQTITTNKELHVDDLIHELAKHSFSKPLDYIARELLTKLSDTCSEQSNSSQLYLYLELLLCQNAFLEMEEVTQVNSGDFTKIKSLHDVFTKQQDKCSKILQSLSQKSFMSDLSILIHKFCNNFNLENNNKVLQSEISHFPEATASQLFSLCQSNLLERFSKENVIIAKKKPIESDISANQKQLITEFKKHSPEQVQGFYFEEFGYFKADMLCSKLAISGDTGASTGLFGVTRLQLEKIIERLINKGYIINKDSFYSIVPEKSSYHLFQINEILSLMADFPLSQENKGAIAEKLRKFFLQAANATSNFSFKDKASEELINDKLQAEKDIHQSKMLDAHFFLKSKFPQLSMAECQHAVLTGQYPTGVDSSSVRNALVRYLLHKTEMQHIENIQKAPLSGERGKIELLTNKRQYNVDLIFKTNLNGNERVAQIIQLAFLFFEADYGCRCNANQVELFRALMLPNQDPEAIDAIQARMGFGKTILLPLMALVQVAIESKNEPDAKSLIRYVVPKAVIEDNSGAFNNRVANILGSNVIKDKEFSRYQIGKDKKATFKFIKDDLNQRLKFYQTARKNGVVLIQWPEIRQSMEAQELAFGYMICKEGLNEKEKALCLECKQLLGKIRSMTTYTVFDELDATQDFKSCEVNYTEGEKTPIDKATLKPLNILINCVQSSTLSDHTKLAQEMLNKLEEREWSDEFISSLLDKTKKVADIDDMNDIKVDNNTLFQGVLLTRAILSDENILAFIKSKLPNTHFGVRFKLKDGQKVYYEDSPSKSALLIAVPYEGANTPKGMAIFDNTEVAAIATICYYSSSETSLEKEPHLDFLITQQRLKAIPEELTQYVIGSRNSAEESFLDKLTELTQLQDKTEINLAKEKFYNDFLKHPTKEVRTYFGAAVVATQVRSDAARANSNRYEMGSIKDIIRGCSGTVGGTSSYFTKPQIDPASDGKLSLDIMGRDNNSQVEILPIPREGEEYLPSTLSALLSKANKNTRAIIDAAGICKSSDGMPETVVAQLWQLMKNGKTSMGKVCGIIYYGKDNVKRLYCGPSEAPITCTTAMEKEALVDRKYFSFYGQKNTRGSDIQQADGVHALVTMDENVSNSDAKQAILRLRSLVNRSSNQTFSFIITNKFEKVLRERNKTLASTSSKTSIDSKLIANHLRKMEMEHDEHDSLIIFKKELNSHVKQAAAHIEHALFGVQDLKNGNIKTTYLDFLKKMNEISIFVEESITTLEGKYGQGLMNLNKKAYIEEQRMNIGKKIYQLFDLGKKTVNNLKPNPKESFTYKIDRLFFCKRVDDSVKIFQSRYHQDRVCVSTVNSGAIAIAQAQAQAQSHAQALAENLSEAEVHIMPRKEFPRCDMTQIKQFKVTDDWLNDPQGKTVDEYTDENLKKLINPFHHKKVCVSPHLQRDDKRLASHFALVPRSKNADGMHIFISQEEAAAFKKYLKTGNKKLKYKLRYLCDPLNDNDSHILNGMKAAILNNKDTLNKAILAVNKNSSTETLRKLNLENVTNIQLIPSLGVKIDSGEKSLVTVVDFKKFGVTKKMDSPLEFQITLPNQDSKEIKLMVDNISTSVIMGNKLFDEAIKEAYAGQAPGAHSKLKSAYDIFLENNNNKLIALDRFKKEQEEMVKNLLESGKRNMGKLSSFTLSEKMKTGLIERDKEFKTDHNRSRLPSHVKTCGDEFIKMSEEIRKHQAKCLKELTKENLNLLLAMFKKFASDKVLVFSEDSTIPIFSREEWQNKINNNDETCFDLVYGRILFEIHHGYTYDASQCPRDDCKQMFAETLPGIIKAIKSIYKIKQDIDNLENEIKQKTLEFQNKSGINEIMPAKECFERLLGAEKEMKTRLNEKGVLFGDKDAPFNMFHLHSFKDLKESVNFKVQGDLPDYVRVVPNFVGGYGTRITALTKNEEEVLKQHKYLQERVIKLAANLEKRDSEVIIINKLHK